MRTSKFSPRIRGELEGGKIKTVSFSTKASGIVKYLEKPNTPQNSTSSLGHGTLAVVKLLVCVARPIIVRMACARGRRYVRIAYASPPWGYGSCLHYKREWARRETFHFLMDFPDRCDPSSV